MSKLGSGSVMYPRNQGSSILPRDHGSSLYPSRDKLHPDNSTTAYRRKPYDTSNYHPKMSSMNLYPQDRLSASVNEFTQSLPPQKDFFAARMKMSGSFDMDRACPPPADPAIMPVDTDARSTDSGIECDSTKRQESTKSYSSQASMCFKRDTGDEDDDKWSSIKEAVTLQYILETFTETRTTSWAHEAYVGQPVDGQSSGAAPGPWDIAIQPPQAFEDFTQDMPIPHTDIVKACHECASIGRVRCWRCHGRGRLVCQHCDGSGRETYFEYGHHHHRSCTWCHGTGRNRCNHCIGHVISNDPTELNLLCGNEPRDEQALFRCNHCIGHGQVACKTCDGRATLKCYVKLTLTWTNHVSDHNVERKALPAKLMKFAQGGTVYEEMLPRVWPINHFPDDSINKASTEFIKQHASSFPSERILMQRHRVVIVPKSQSKSTPKRSQKNVYAMGFEQGMLDGDYNCFKKCLMRCSIL